MADAHYSKTQVELTETADCLSCLLVFQQAFYFLQHFCLLLCQFSKPRIIYSPSHSPIDDHGKDQYEECIYRKRPHCSPSLPHDIYWIQLCRSSSFSDKSVISSILTISSYYFNMIDERRLQMSLTLVPSEDNLFK